MVGCPFITMPRMDGLEAPPAEPGSVLTGDPTPAHQTGPPVGRPEVSEPPATAGDEDAGDGPAFSPRMARLLVVGAVAVVVLGIALRFVARSDMWLDEALTLNIARLPLGQIHGALRRDGAPPLYYYLLHFWSGAFGTSDVAVRALSGVLSCATLPFIWLAGRRLGGKQVAVASLVLVATSPFAIRYATENRMYALVGFLTAAGVVALQQVFHRRTVANVVAVALLTGLLLYSHYWALYLVGVTALWLAFQAWRGPEARRPGARGRIRRRRRGVPELRSVGPDLPLPGAPHRDPVGETGRLRSHGQRRDVLRRGSHEPGPRARAPVLRARRAGTVRRGPRLVPRGPRPSHPASGPGPGAGAHRDIGRRGDWGVRQPECVPGALRVGGVRAPRAVGGSRVVVLRRQPDPHRGTHSHRRLRGGERPSERVDEPNPGRPGRDHAGPARPARRHRGVLSRPDRSRREPAGSPGPLPRDHLPPRHQSRNS